MCKSITSLEVRWIKRKDLAIRDVAVSTPAPTGTTASASETSKLITFVLYYILCSVKHSGVEITPSDPNFGSTTVLSVIYCSSKLN